mgnify:CR=1 FL=1
MTDTDDNETVYKKDTENGTFAVSEVLNSDGTTSTFKYDEQYNVLHAVDENGITVSNTYDNMGNLKTHIDPNGTTSYEYDDKNREIKVTDPTGIPTIKTYEGENLSSTKVGEETTVYEYDSYGRETKVIYPNHTYEETAYDDATDKITEKVSGITYRDIESDQILLQKNLTYNDRSLLESYTQGKYKIGYTYNENEQPLNSTISYSKDTDLWKVEQSLNYTDEGKTNTRTVRVNEQNLMVFDYDYNLANNQQIVSVNGLYQKTNTSNQSNLLESIVYTQGSNTSLEYDYRYDGSDNILKEKSKQGVTSYTYDNNNQLIKEVLPDGTMNQYSYDDVGNRKENTRGERTDTFTYNAANQISTKNDVVYKYDTDGNLIQDEHYKYEYNALGYQTRVTDLQGKEVASYDYDEAGLRTKKIMGSKTHEYYYDDNQLSLEVIRNGDSIEQYRNYQWDGYTHSSRYGHS